MTGCWLNTENNGNIVDGLDVIGCGQVDAEWVVGVDRGGRLDAGDDCGGGRDEGGGQDGNGSSCETHIDGRGLVIGDIGW